MTSPPRRIGMCPRGVGSMIASRRLARPTGPAAHSPAPSGPRWAMTSPMRRRTSSVTGAPERSRTPAMPHMPLAPRLAQRLDDALLVVAGHAGEQRQREREPLGEVGAGELALPQPVALAVQ